MIDVSEPTLFLNTDICRSNIKRMAQKAQKHDLAFKPHMKTHQSAEIGEWLKEEGVTSITVSSVTMANYFADYGWHDITIAFPCNIRQMEEINDLADKISLTLLINNLTAAKALRKQLESQVDIYIELDTGSNRTGLKISDLKNIKHLISFLNSSEKLNWIGFYSHPGHSYSARSKKEIIAIHESVLSQVKDLKNELDTEFKICIGDTPCCSVADNFANIDAISPGNFVFYDLMQKQIGSCGINDIATAMVCPVVDKYDSRNELAIYGGAIHFSKEMLKEKDLSHYGLAAETNGNGWNLFEGTYLKALSQEHGLVKCSSTVFDQFSVGDCISILPVHSCLTANLMGSYTLSDGNQLKQLNG